MRTHLGISHQYRSKVVNVTGRRVRVHSSTKKAKKTTPTRFELARAEPNRFLVYRLNRSATVS